MSYGSNAEDNFRRIAALWTPIPKGPNPGALPDEEPTTREEVNNMKTDNAHGLRIPAGIKQGGGQLDRMKGAKQLPGEASGARAPNRTVQSGARSSIFFFLGN